jgi:hypothetical protein
MWDISFCKNILLHPHTSTLVSLPDLFMPRHVMGSSCPSYNFTTSPYAYAAQIHLDHLFTVVLPSLYSQHLSFVGSFYSSISSCSSFTSSCYSFLSLCTFFVVFSHNHFFSRVKKQHIHKGSSIYKYIYSLFLSLIIVISPPLVASMTSFDINDNTISNILPPLSLIETLSYFGTSCTFLILVYLIPFHVLQISPFLYTLFSPPLLHQ